MPNLNLQEEESVIKEILRLYRNKLRLTAMPPLINSKEQHWEITKVVQGESRTVPGYRMKFSLWQRLKWKLGIGVFKIK